MRWIGGRRSTNVQDRRGMGPGLVGGGGIGAVVIALLYMLLGGDPSQMPQPQPGGQTPTAPADPNAPPDEGRLFIERTVASTEDAWNEIFRQQGADYQEPGLDIYEGGTPTGCGYGQSAMGPFYCPSDQKVYIDLGFFEDMRTKLGGGGDFAQAYVIAHEVGHHVQTVTGISQRVTQLSQQVSKAEANQLSVRQELQADCYAGLWAKHAQGKTIQLETGDIEEALSTAAAIGDDRLQRQAQGRVVPESFTHGSSEQRVRWFRRGFESGDVQACDTFNASQL